MKFVKILIPIVISVFTIALITTPTTSCNKKVLIHDTTTVTLHDTTVIKDTLTLHDTVGCCNINTDMVAYYTFTGGSLKDSSGNNNDIVFNNATKTTDAYGNANGAYLFDGATSYMQVKHNATLNPTNISLMARVKFNGFWNGTCHGNQIFMKGYSDQTAGSYGLRAINVTVDCYATAADTNKEVLTGFYGDYPQVAAASDTGYVHSGHWVTVVFTYDGYESKYYVNGKLTLVKAGTGQFTPNTYDLFIGRAENANNLFWLNGVVDEVRIYNKALCAAAVAQLSGVSQAK